MSAAIALNESAARRATAGERRYSTCSVATIGVRRCSLPIWSATTTAPSTPTATNCQTEFGRTLLEVTAREDHDGSDNEQRDVDARVRHRPCDISRRDRQSMNGGTLDI